MTTWEKIKETHQALQAIVEKARPSKAAVEKKTWFKTNPVSPLGEAYNPFLQVLPMIPDGSVYVSLKDSSFIEALEPHFQQMKFYSYPLALDNPSTDRANWKARLPFSVLSGTYLSSDGLAWNNGITNTPDDREAQFKAVWDKVDTFLGLSDEPWFDLTLANRIAEKHLLLKFPTLFDDSAYAHLILLSEHFPNLTILAPENASIFSSQYYVWIENFHSFEYSTTLFYNFDPNKHQEIRDRLNDINKQFKERIISTLKG